MAPEYTLDELQYSNDRKGPFQLYIYEPDGYHRGGQWFRKVPKYIDPPDNEIDYHEAMLRAREAEALGCEVRIVDGGDMLVYHYAGGKILYPKSGNFWLEINGIALP